MQGQMENADQYQPRLVIYVVWHPAFERGGEIADRIYTYFSRDPGQPNARGLGIPVFYRSAAAAGSKVPPSIALGRAHHTAVVVLVDSKMVIDGDEGWAGYIGDIWKQVGTIPERHRIFPVALHNSAYQLSPDIAEVNFIRLQKIDPMAAQARLLNTLTNELGRLLTERPPLVSVSASDAPSASPPRMRLFISHAKLDGEKTAIALRDYIHQNLALDTFFDAIDITTGFRFEDEINAGIDRAAFVIVQTDAYASRAWCQHEVIRAKRHARPLVVIHAIEEGEARSFPYIGNVPTIRWRANEPERIGVVLGLILREVLRSEHFQQQFEDLKALFGAPATARALPRAPELLTCLALRAESASVPFFVYPDPPLAKQELDLLTELDPGLRLTTPTLLFAKPAEPIAFASRELEKAAAGWRIGISISDSPDLAVRGFGSAHLRDSAAEFARFLLAAGATLAYGGDLRQGGFSDVLFELLTAYRAISGEAVNAIQSYLAWPIYLDLSESQQADLMRTARFHKISPPDDLNVDISRKIPPTTPEGRVIWARCLTAMRERMNGEIHARLLIGGQAHGLGKYPGLAEEALLAMRSKKPVFLVGAFGGCSQAIIQAICGEKPLALTLGFQAEQPDARGAIDLYNSNMSASEAIDYPALTAFFEQADVKGLNNGLTEDENRRLFTTTHLPEMIALVLRGLSRLGTPPSLSLRISSFN